MTDIYEPETLTASDPDLNSNPDGSGGKASRGWRLPVRLTKSTVDLSKPDADRDPDGDSDDEEPIETVEAIGEVTGNADTGAVEGVVVYHPTSGRTRDGHPSVQPSADAAGRLLVDPPSGDFVTTRRRDRDRHPIIPAWVRDPESMKAAAKWAVNYYAHCTAFHLVRLPAYWGRLAARSHVGAYRIVSHTTLWVLDYQNHMVRSALVVKAADPHSFLRLREEHRNIVRFRAGLVALAGLPILVAIVMVAMATPLAKLVAVATTLAALGWVGRKDNTRLTGRAVDRAEVPRLTEATIIKALTQLGLGQIRAALKEDGIEAIGFPSPITRDGAGFRADIDLPGGVTAAEVLERRGKLASGLRRPLGCVWPEADMDMHAGRLVLYVADKSLSESKPSPWPLAKAGKVNIFAPITIGVDQRGRAVLVTLMFVAGLIGAIPRMGKTFYLRLLLLAAGLDPRVEVHGYNLKGGSDLACLEQFAHAYKSGGKDEVIEYIARDLRGLKVEMERRYDLIETLPREKCPESKVTDELASDRSLGLHPVLFAVDECQVMFEHAVYGKEIEGLVDDLVRRGPAVGVMVWLATQRVDAKSIPKGISSNAALRLCLKVTGQLENDMVLGTSMYKNGTRATMFSRKDLGIAFLAGEAEDPQIVRGSYVDAEAAWTISLRARAARDAANRLTGLAAGIDELPPAEDTASILDHLLTVWPTNDAGDPDPKVWCHVLADLLARTWPGTYQGWEGKQVTAAVAPHGLRSTQVKRGGVNNNGLDYAALVKATNGRTNDSTGDSTGGMNGGEDR